jgi:hypothetical protein
MLLISFARANMVITMMAARAVLRHPDGHAG